MEFKRFLAKNYINAVGCRLKGHYVVIESDDWGSIRLHDKDAYNRLKEIGYNLDSSYFDKYDSLESPKDLEAVYDTLHSVRDRNNHCAVLTPIYICANPNYEEIKKRSFTEYVYETFPETYKRFNRTENTFYLVKQGLDDETFLPQFHGREHIHARRWMKALKEGRKTERLSIENNSIVGSVLQGDEDLPTSKSCFPAFSYDSFDEFQDLREIAHEGLRLFEDIFGYKASSFCPPCGIVHDDLLESLTDYGVLGLQCGQHIFRQSDGSLKLVNHKWGDRSRTGQVYWRRNCTFEPSRNHDQDWVDSCMSEIKIAFFWGKPAVINSHRVNFIGSIFPENRDKTLKQLNRLLKEIVKTWPDVQFISSAQLLDLLLKKVNRI